MSDTVRPIAPSNREAILQRLRRIEGQVRGVQRMVEDGQDCRKVVHQLKAIKAALSSLNGVVLECYAHNCLDNADQVEDETVAELIAMILKSST